MNTTQSTKLVMSGWGVLYLVAVSSASCPLSALAEPTPTATPTSTPAPEPDCEVFQDPQPGDGPAPLVSPNDPTGCGTLAESPSFMSEAIAGSSLLPPPNPATPAMTNLANQANSLTSGRTKSGGYCYRGVKRAIYNAGIMPVGSLTGAKAVDAANELSSARKANGSLAFQPVCLNKDPKSDPAGTIHVYQRINSSGQAVTNAPGHIDISLGGGRLGSDFQTSRNPGSSVYRLIKAYVPK